MEPTQNGNDIPLVGSIGGKTPNALQFQVRKGEDVVSLLVVVEVEDTQSEFHYAVLNYSTGFGKSSSADFSSTPVSQNIAAYRDSGGTFSALAVPMRAWHGYDWNEVLVNPQKILLELKEPYASRLSFRKWAFIRPLGMLSLSNIQLKLCSPD